MKESVFNAELIRSLDHWGAYAYKIVDLPASMTFGLRYVPEKPCDIIGGFHGKFFGIEAKQMKKFEAFGLRHLRPAQIKHLSEMTARGNRAFVFLNIRIAANKGMAIKQTNRVVIFDWDDLKDREQSYKQKEVLALPYISYQRVKRHQDDAGEIIYDLKPFLEML